MPNYIVRWEMPIEASSPEAAAARALVVQRDPESIATVFDVQTEGGEIVRIDMDDENARDELQLAELEAEFEAAGGRGIDLAEEIDRLRAKLSK